MCQENKKPLIKLEKLLKGRRPDKVEAQHMSFLCIY
jgi:hypothetical protein